MRQKTVLSILTIFAVVLSLLGNIHAAEKYPTRPIELVCGYPPGTGPDILNRILAQLS